MRADLYRDRHASAAVIALVSNQRVHALFAWYSSFPDSPSYRKSAAKILAGPEPGQPQNLRRPQRFRPLAGIEVPKKDPSSHLTTPPESAALLDSRVPKVRWESTWLVVHP